LNYGHKAIRFIGRARGGPADGLSATKKGGKGFIHIGKEAA
jgi:hypothetical protein